MINTNDGHEDCYDVEIDIIMEISIYLFLLFYIIVKFHRMQDGTKQNA